jgi:ABC-type antimicrobial peptide transport system permease subunit
VAAARERLEEFALLRALGLSGSQLVVWQSLEQAFTLLIGASIGLGLGVVLAWLVLPAATLTQSGAPPVPPAVVVVPWRSLVPLAIVGLLLLASTVLLVSRLLRTADVVAILRSGEE